MSAMKQRALAQRTRILEAARICFDNSGFHSASMATIAETAGMSPGLIYRYFENKNAIILAIIEEQLNMARHKIRELRAAEDIGTALLEYFDAQDDPARPQISTALFLEMSAAATRDPEIAEAIQRFDKTVIAELKDWLSRSPEEGGHGLPEDVAEERALSLVCLIEGLEVRRARQPDHNRELLQHAIDASVNSLIVSD